MASLLEVVRVRIDEIRARVIKEQETLNGWGVRHAKHLAPDVYDYVEEGWSEISVGDIWARQGQTAFLRKDVVIPGGWAGERVGLELVTGGEGLLRVDGLAFHGVDDNRGYILLTPSATAGQTYHCEVELRTSNDHDFVIIDNRVEYVVREAHLPYILSAARLFVVDADVEAAYYDAKVAWDAAAAQNDLVFREAILLAIKGALQGVDFRSDHPEFRSALALARETLRNNLDAIAFGGSAGKVFFAGHSHIDLAWLWPLKETARKVGRTYSTVMALMDEYPDYHFVCSQAPLFLMLKKHFPEVYERVRKRVSEGRFEPIGGTWVENDCNLISGESLVRQCLYGQRFFREEFGIKVRVGWLPDVFGYSPAMPQIYRKSGLDYFMTVKLVANDTNRFPYNTFWWQGIDGTRLLTHYVHGHYAAMVKPDEMISLRDDYNAKQSSPEALSPYGYGDGGGGPTREMLEYLPRLSNTPGVPRASTGRVHDFFDSLVSDGTDHPVWNGELYFELHRGTYTSQAKNKRNNRKCEITYRDAELWSSVAATQGKEYPKAELVEGWKGILLNQFHDIIPGSSIGEVYADSDKQYEEILHTGESVRREATTHLAGQIDTFGQGNPVVVFNSLSWDRTDVVSLEVDEPRQVRVVDPNGEEAPSQLTDGKLTFVVRDLPSCGYGVYRVTEGATSGPSPFAVDGEHISTPYYELVMAPDGTIRRLYDRVNSREVIPAGARANVLQVFEDKPSNWDAWDIELQYQDKAWEFEAQSSPKVLESGPVRLVLGIKLAYGSSCIDQRIVFYAHTPRIDFVSHVDWQERSTLLKVAFPVEVHSARATYEIAFGVIERPTHWNTSWDRARFEVCGHRWADLSESGYGVSVLNDCKYGWDIKDNQMRLTLLRSPEKPDPEADRGEHEFTYCLCPHAGDWTSGTVRAAHELNSPLMAIATDPHAGPLGPSASFVSVDNAGVVVDTVKQSEDTDVLVVRVYEAHGSRGPVVLTFDRPIGSVVACNLLEEPECPVDSNGCELRFSIKPFEVRSFLLTLDGQEGLVPHERG